VCRPTRLRVVTGAAGPGAGLDSRAPNATPLTVCSNRNTSAIFGENIYVFRTHGNGRVVTIGFVELLVIGFFFI